MDTSPRQAPTPPPVAVDLRPLPIVLLTRFGRWIVFLALGIALFAVANAPTPEGLTIEGQRALGVFGVCVVLWITNLLPLVVTGLLAMTLLPLLGVLPAADAFAVLGNPAVLFILGAFILAAAMVQSQLSERVALAILSLMGTSPWRLSLGLLLGAAFLSYWMPEHAVAAMLLPIALQVAHTLKLRRNDSMYARQLFLALAWGAVIGGVGTLLGGARAPLALAVLRDYTSPSGNPQTISFLEWMIPVLPLVAGMLVIAAIMLRLFFPAEVTSVEPARAALASTIRQRGRMTLRERGVAAVLFGTIVCWIAFGHTVGLATIALGSVVTLFVFRLVTWDSVEAYVNWGIILMYGGAIGLGSALSKTGAAEWLVTRALAGSELTPWMLIVGLSVMVKLLTEGMSNTAVVALVLPLALTLGDQLGIPLRLVVFSVAIPAGMAFLLPMSSPPNAIAYASGYLRLRDVLVPGLILNVASWLLFLAVARWYWPLIGMEWPT